MLTKRQAPKERNTSPLPVTKKREIKAKQKIIIPEYCSKGSINVMLAQTYKPESHSIAGWLMSEKLDGVRCYWSGSVLFSRNGVKINAPKEWTNHLP